MVNITPEIVMGYTKFGHGVTSIIEAFTVSVFGKTMPEPIINDIVLRTKITPINMNDGITITPAIIREISDIVVSGGY